VDLCLFNAAPERMIFGTDRNSCHFEYERYIALGELKGGIDPAGADEHWKTASTALERIRSAFSSRKLKPKTFFIGAAIEKAMAAEIFEQLSSGILDNAANLTDEDQLVSVSNWLINI
jgi:type II restriction enzyme